MRLSERGGQACPQVVFREARGRRSTRDYRFAVAVASVTGATIASLFSGCTVRSTSAVIEDHRMTNLKNALEEIPREDAEVLLGHALENTAILLYGFEVIRERGLTLRSSPNSGVAHGWSAAVPVSPDGYFLTAAHNLQGGDVMKMKLVLFIGQDDYLVSPLRVVWSSGKADPDLALVHAEIRPPEHLEVDAVTSDSDARWVVTSGWASMGDGVESLAVRSVLGSQSVSFGKVLSVSKVKREKVAGEDCRYRVVTHDAPSGPGDSGGPILGADGLVGINSRGFFGPAFVFPMVQSKLGSAPGRLSGYHGVAFATDPVWLDQLMERDRAGR